MMTSVAELVFLSRAVLMKARFIIGFDVFFIIYSRTWSPCTVLFSFSINRNGSTCLQKLSVLHCHFCVSEKSQGPYLIRHTRVTMATSMAQAKNAEIWIIVVIMIHGLLL